MASPAAKSAYLGWVAAAIAGERGASPTFAAAEHDLILGYATGYEAADVAVFVRSLRAVYAGPVVLVTDQEPALLDFLAQYGVESAPPPAACSGVWRPHPVMQRFAAFDALMSERPWARHVLLTDVRDVVFQAPPFDPPPQKLEFFVEYDGGLKGHAFNMKYLRGVGGEDVARALAEKPCVCVGTVMGPRACMIRFCRTLLMLAAIPRSEIGGAFGADQAACNIALHLGLVEGETQPNYGRIATVGLTPGGGLSLDGTGRIVNPDGGVSPIVHQYDRHPALMAAIHERWGQGFEARERRRSKSLSERGRKLRDSFARRLPELR